MTTADLIFLVIGLTGFGGLFICIGAGLYLAYTQMDLMLEHLKHCPAVMDRTFLIHAGPWGRLIMLGGVMGVLIRPRRYIGNSDVSVDDIDNFLSSLKKRLIFLFWACGGFLFLVCGLGVLIKLNYI